jgi:hypothetical protein
MSMSKTPQVRNRMARPFIKGWAARRSRSTQLAKWRCLKRFLGVSDREIRISFLVDNRPRNTHNAQALGPGGAFSSQGLKEARKEVDIRLSIAGLRRWVKRAAPVAKQSR